MIHPHSLLPIAAHNVALVRLLQRPVSASMVDHVARAAARCVGAPVHAPPPPAVTQFITRLVVSSRLSTATLLSCLVYFDRLGSQMASLHHASTSSMHRIILATVIVSAKYLNDSAPKNVHWRDHCGRMFDLNQVNLMERQLLALLEFDLRFDENDACRHFAPFMPKPRPAPNSPDSLIHSLTRRLSRAQIAPTTELDAPRSQLTVPPPALSRTVSSSTCGSLTDDSGSSSSSSSCGWSESEESEDEAAHVTVYTDDSAPPSPQVLKKPFILRPATYRPRPRKPSDTSSICTVRGVSASSSRSSVKPVKNFAPTKGFATSATMPAIPRSGNGGGFLSRVWGAFGHDRESLGQEGALKRLVLVSSRSERFVV